MDLLNGAMFGALFGFLLQRAHILRFDKQLGMLLFRDMTVLKFMLSAAFVGMVLYQLCESTLLITLPARPVYLVPMALGGVIFGLGWAITGYCPGTQLGAVGEGRIDGLWAVLGGIAGSTLYYFAYYWCRDRLFPIGAYDGLDLDVALGINPWLVIAVLGALFAFTCWAFERRGR